MKILFVITGLGLGGAEKQICLLAEQYANMNHQVAIVSLTGETIIKPENQNVEIYCLNMKKSPMGLLTAIFKLRQIIGRLKPDIVHSHMFHANIMMRLAGIFTHRSYKLLCTAHSKNEGGKIRMLAYRLTDSLCDINTNVSNEALDEFIKQKSFSKEKSFVVYNGIDTEKFHFNSVLREAIREKLAISEHEILILAVGRLTPAKDYPNLLNAFRLLPDYYKLVIIGEGEVRKTLEHSIMEYGLASRVTLLGSISNVQDYYSACDLFVLSSAWEGFGLVVAEAMACERIAVCTDAGGVKEVIGDTHYIVPVSNAKALADKILDVETLSAERKKVVQTQNRTHVMNNFSITSVVNNWLNMYTSQQDNR